MQNLETLLIIFFLLLIVWIFISIVVWSYYNGISPTPTSSKAKKCLLKALPDNVKGNIFELGSGWGTLAFPLARRFPHCQVIGFESSPVPYIVSKLRKALSGQKNLQFFRRDFLKEDLQNASLIVCYLYPGAMRKLKDKFESELQPGTYVISNTFAIPGWQPEKVYEVGDLYRTKIYLYQKKTVKES